MNLEIEKLVYGGDGLAHHDGQTLFVPFVLPGEVIEAEISERKKKFVRARLVKIVSPSTDRTAPPCPHFLACGGCHYQHIQYEAQVHLKSEILRETLWRIGRIRWDDTIQAHPSSPFGYRNRVQWKIRPRNAANERPAQLAEGERGGRPLNIGYFRASSTALCPIHECPILSPKLEDTLQILRGMLERGELPEALREVQAFVDDSDSKLLLNAALASFPSSPRKIADQLRSLPGVESVLLQESAREGMELFGPGFVHYSAAGTSYRVGHLSFFQTNRFLVNEMVNTVTSGEQGALAMDLFAGVGLFAAALAKRFDRVIAVESNPAAARDLQVNLESASAAQPVNAEADKFLGDSHETPDLAVLDPPRTGVPAPALTGLARLQPKRITYLSCDPSTLSRDLAQLTAAAYEISEIHLFDVFPQTFHIEALVRLVAK